MPLDQVLELPDGRKIGFNNYSEGVSGAGFPVLYCHGGPGSRILDPKQVRIAASLGLRVITIDRPGYGLSSLKPGRTIADFVSDGLAVADHLGISTFHTIGISTGGAYAFALAALAPERVIGVITGCAMTDMSHPPARESMPLPITAGIWSCPDRESAVRLAQGIFGEDGLAPPKDGTFAPSFPPADLAAMQDPEALVGDEERNRAKFANGVEGYVDDRLADGPGWDASFDVSRVVCPVTLVHGASDTVVPVLAAHHTASLLPHAELRIFAELGHMSIGAQAYEAAADMARRHASNM